MTSREGRTFFERLCAMREAYADLDARDGAELTPIWEAIAFAQLELALISPEADSQSADGQAGSTQQQV
ncbi:MAG TPA: hypothetical protein VGM28_00725 [Candidatus Limnocylindrales bacterium]|jgi:hypothetical protein